MLALLGILRRRARLRHPASEPQVGALDGIEWPDEAEDPKEDPPQQVVADPQVQPGALYRHSLIRKR